MTGPGPEWVEPPPRAMLPGAGIYSRTGKWTAVSAALRERPGEWARIATGAKVGLATAVRRGRSPSWEPAGAFEAEARRQADGTYDVYARYVGDAL